MTIGIGASGIVERFEDGECRILVPGIQGGPATEIAIPPAIAELHRAWTGDVVEGTVEDGRLVAIARINGIGAAEAAERPAPKEKRAGWERVAPHHRIQLARAFDDITGQELDRAAPLARGTAGMIYGPHGAGLTHTLRTVMEAATANAPELVPIVLLVRARGEEVTDWRRRFPDADIVVCPSMQTGASADETLRVADLVLACAQRQTEQGRDVLLAVDSLTGIWAAMLELEEADAQREADQSSARARIQQWVRAAGEFSGEGPLGMTGPGGSLTLLGAAWHQAIEVEAEEEGETHPHLRLIEHILNEMDWRIPLSGEMARQRLFPAIDFDRVYSRLA